MTKNSDIFQNIPNHSQSFKNAIEISQSSASTSDKTDKKFSLRLIAE